MDEKKFMIWFIVIAVVVSATTYMFTMATMSNDANDVMDNLCKQTGYEGLNAISGTEYGFEVRCKITPVEGEEWTMNLLS